MGSGLHERCASRRRGAVRWHNSAPVAPDTVEARLQHLVRSLNCLVYLREISTPASPWHGDPTQNRLTGSLAHRDVDETIGDGTLHELTQPAHPVPGPSNLTLAVQSNVTASGLCGRRDGLVPALLEHERHSGTGFRIVMRNGTSVSAAMSTAPGIYPFDIAIILVFCPVEQVVGQCRPGTAAAAP